jgi:hypothetical protein
MTRSAALLLTLLVQAAQAPPLPELRTTLGQLRNQLDAHQATRGATAELTEAKHRLREWIESRISELGEGVDVVALGERLHGSLSDAGLLCTDFQFECRSNLLGYVDDVRVWRAGGFLFVVTAMGISCGYDESAYVYSWGGGQWRRLWEHEQSTYTEQAYRPQTIHDVQMSPPDARGSRLIMALGSQAACSGSFKDLYARAWRIDASGRSRPVLDWTGRGNDGYPPIQGRVAADDVIVQYTADGFLSGSTHSAVRHFRIDGNEAAQIDPIAGRPRDFVLEWLGAPWEESRTRSESASLEAAHAQLRRTDGVGDFPEPVLRCGEGSDLWQVGTNLFEGPKRYYRVRWREPYTFTMVSISDTPYPDCAVRDPKADVYPKLLTGS